MLADVERIALLPRFTPLVGAMTFNTKIYDVSKYSSAKLVAWVGAGNGTSPAVSFQVQESTDMTIWSDVDAPLEPTAGTEATATSDLTQKWMRIAVTVSGTDPAVSCWLSGEFSLRAR